MAYKTAPPIIITIVLACFWGESIGQRPGQTVLSCRCSPLFLPQSLKVGARKRKWGRQPYCHTSAFARSRAGNAMQLFACSLPLLKGEMLSVFFFFCFLWSGSCPLPFFGKKNSLLLRFGLCDKFSGANFCFCSFFGSVCFWYGFAYGFRVFSHNFAPDVS